VVSHDVWVARQQIPAGMPGWRRADCLGCDEVIVQSRHGWVTVAGTRSGSWLAAWPTRPDLSVATDPDNIPADGIYLLGVAHPQCMEAALHRLRGGGLELPADLPTVTLETDIEFDGDEEPLLHLPGTADRCPFCNAAGDLTAEHVWPDWFIKAVAQRGDSVSIDGVARPLRHLTIDVCGTCNNEWMSVLEQDARTLLADMLRTRRTTLDAAQQERLAAWATLKAYELEYLSRRTTPRGYLQDLRNKRVPPHGISVWLGAYTPDEPARAWIRYHRVSALSPDGPVGVNVFSVTFTLYQVVLQVIGHYVAGNVVMRDSGPAAGAISQLWPVSDEQVTWPLPQGFSHDSIGWLVNRIDDGSVPGPG
jgi:hypothetical protein